MGSEPERRPLQRAEVLLQHVPGMSPVYPRSKEWGLCVFGCWCCAAQWFPTALQTGFSQTSSYFDAISRYQEEKAMCSELRILLLWWFTEKYVATKMLPFGVEPVGVEHLSQKSPGSGLSVRTQTPVQTELLSKPLCQGQ